MKILPLIVFIYTEWHLCCGTSATVSTNKAPTTTSQATTTTWRKKGCMVGSSFRRGTMNSIADFEEMVKCSTFVDKSGLLIDFFLNSGPRQFNLVTCPHKFGKSINLSMMRKFLEGSISIEDSKVSKTYDSDVYDFFTNPHYNFTIGPEIQNITDFHKEHFQAYAVIHISFKTKASDTFKELVKGLQDNFKKCFEEYKWLTKFRCEDRYSECAKDLDLLKKTIEGTNANDVFGRCLVALARLLNEFSPMKDIFLLIDDYDDPIIQEIEYGFDVESSVRLIEEIFSSLFPEHGRLIRYALITGNINILDKTKFSHFKHWSFLDNHHFTKYFGFTTEEVEQLLNEHGINKPDRSVIESHYGGYSVSSCTKRIYNPYSIANYLCRRNPNNAELMTDKYWADATNVPNFLQCFRRNRSYQELLLKCLSLKKITFNMKTIFDINMLEKLQDIRKDKSYKLSDFRLDTALSYLFHQGYLSYADTPNTYRIPNEEIASALNETACNVDETFSQNQLNEKLARLDPDKPVLKRDTTIKA